MGFAVQLVPQEVPKKTFRQKPNPCFKPESDLPMVVAPTAKLEVHVAPAIPVVATAAAVALAGTLLGEPAARPVTVLVCPVTTVVEVVN